MRFNSAILLAFGSSVLHASTVHSSQVNILNLDIYASVGLTGNSSDDPRRIGEISQPSVWDVQPDENGQVILSIGGYTATTRDGQVYGELQDDNHQKWVLQIQGQSETYTIQTPDGACGWILGSDADDNQVVNCGALSSNPQANELWEITTTGTD